MTDPEEAQMPMFSAREKVLFTLLAIGMSARTFGQDLHGETTRVSVSYAGQEANKDSLDPVLSADARFVAFKSEASNLVAGDTNNAIDAFVHDRVTGATVRVSVGSSGVEGNGFCLNASISADGRFVVFGSTASNLVPGDTNGTADVFVHELSSGQTSRASVDSSGVQGNDWSNAWGDSAAISADVRYVAFSSLASNLVSGDTNGTSDVFVHDRIAGQTMRASVGSAGTQSALYSSNPSLSADGRFVAFQSLSGSLAGSDTNLAEDIFVHDRQSGSTTLVSSSSAGNAGNAASFEPSIGSDGRFVAFTSFASDLVTMDTNGTADVFVHDRQTGQTERVSVDGTGAEALLGSTRPALSPDGRYVAFESGASNLVPGDTNAKLDVFVHDRQTGNTWRVSLDGAGIQGNRDSIQASLSADARFVAFAGDSSNLVAGDTNAAADVFVHDEFDCTPSTYCTAKATSHLCAPFIQSIGAPSISAPRAFTIATTELEDGKNALTFFGATGAAAAPFQDGYLCVQPPIYRLAIQNSGGSGLCQGSISYTLEDLLEHGAGGPHVTVGGLLYCQTWGRDPLDAFGSSLSDALFIQVCP